MKNSNGDFFTEKLGMKNSLVPTTQTDLSLIQIADRSMEVKKDVEAKQKIALMEEALQLYSEENEPILQSKGYRTCDLILRVLSI